MCTDQNTCCGDAKVEAIDEAAPAPAPVAQIASCDEGVVCFDNNSYDGSFANRFSSYIDSLKATLKPGQKIKITGLYSSSETYTGSMENLGIHRADVVRQRIAGLLSADQVELASQQVVGRTLGRGDKVTFDIINTSTAPEVAPSTMIYFPYNSTRKLQGAEIENYLSQVATRVKASGERVNLVGHTDSDGPTDSNQALGMRRATIIKDYLVSQGVASSKVLVSSKGEEAPVASNATNEGKALNRRTELTIIK